MMRDVITGETTAFDTRYKRHAGDVSSEYVHGSGAVRCYGTDADGYLVTMQYMGYTRREAVAMFRVDMVDYWARVTA
jgi:hypothetical protein